MKFRVWVMVALVIVVLAALWAVRYIERIPPEQLLSLLGVTVTVSDLNATPTPSPRVTPAGGDQRPILGSVAVQTFAGPKLMRQGPGTAVTADGLILTTAVTAPYGSGSYMYQIATPQGQLFRAQRVATDRTLGLTLLKADATDLDAVLFDEDAAPFAGQQLEAISAQVLLSEFVSQRLPVWVSWSAAGIMTLSMDRSLGYSFDGARLTDGANRSVGLLRYAGSPKFVPAAAINGFLETYLSAQPSP